MVGYSKQGGSRSKEQQAPTWGNRGGGGGRGGDFLEINFIFLVIGHTKNAADRLFNSLKIMYRKTNLYTFNQLVEALGMSWTITVHSTMSKDFLNYGNLFDFFYKKLTGNIKQNHIFNADQGNEIRIRESVLAQHEEFILPIMKKDFKDLFYRDIVDAFFLAAEAFSHIITILLVRDFPHYHVYSSSKSTY